MSLLLECNPKLCGPCDMAIQDFGPGAFYHRASAGFVLTEFGHDVDGICPEVVLGQLGHEERTAVGLRMAALMPQMTEVGGAL